MVRRTGPHTPAGCARSGPTPIPSEAYSPKGSSRTYESGQESGLDVIQRLLTAAWSGCTMYRPKWTWNVEKMGADTASSHPLTIRQHLPIKTRREEVAARLTTVMPQERQPQSTSARGVCGLP